MTNPSRSTPSRFTLARFTLARFTLARTVGTGVALTSIAAYAVAKPGIAVADAPAAPTVLLAELSSASSVVYAFALVALAAWGALLFTRGRLRRLMAVIETAAAACALIALGSWIHDRPGEVNRVLASSGIEGFSVSLTVWPWLSAAGVLGAMVCGVISWRSVGSWPEMGSRYDAPGTASATATTDLTSGVDVWKAIDQGRDPTSDSSA